MSDQAENAPGAVSPPAADTDILLSFELAPSWARTSPDAHHERFRREDRRDDAPHGRGADRDFGRDRTSRREDRGPRRENRPPRRDERPGQPPGAERGPRPAAGDAIGRGPRPAGGPPERGAFVRRDAPPRPAYAPPQELPPLPLEIRLLPEQKALGAIIRRIQTSHRAYPLRDIARLFLDNPASCLVRIESRKEQPMPLFQCKVCGLPALSEEEIRAHVLSTHLEAFFEIAEVEGEAPAGSFVCVARCGLTGELLGPPNHHSYGAKVQEMLRTRFPNMTLETYRNRIEMVREPEVIEQWREQARKRRLFRVKTVKQAAPQAAPESQTDAPPAENAAAPAEEPASPPMERQAAELYFMREILPRQIGTAWHLLATVEVSILSPSQRLNAAIRDVLNREDHFPASLFFALRGAFRHRSLHLFKVHDARGPDFVAVSPPVPLDLTHAVAELRQIMTHVAENPTCTRQELLAALTNGDETQTAHFATQLNWLVEKTHLIEYYNGVLCVPGNFPRFRYLPSERPGNAAQQPRPPKARPAPRPAPQATPQAAPPPSPAADDAAASPAPEPAVAVDAPVTQDPQP